MHRIKGITAAALVAVGVSSVGVGVAQAAPTSYLPPTTKFNVLLGDSPNVTETLAVTPDRHGHLTMRATRATSKLYTYPIQVFWINFATGRTGYVSAPYDADATVFTGSGPIGIGNFVGFPTVPSLGTVQA